MVAIAHSVSVVFRDGPVRVDSCRDCVGNSVRAAGVRHVGRGKECRSSR